MALAFGFLKFLNIILIFHSLYTHVRNTCDDENLHKEPKFIVFISQLLLLFKFCHFCKTDCHLVETTVDGGALIIESNCGNPTCANKRSIWRSQPLMPGSKINAGDFLQSFSILVSGGSPAKVIPMFEHGTQWNIVGDVLQTPMRMYRNILYPLSKPHCRISPD